MSKRAAAAIGACVTTICMWTGTGTAFAAGHHGSGGGGGGGGGGSPAGTGIDVSYPQCPATSLPAGEAFAIVGVDGGLANDYNSCLGAEFSYASQLAGIPSQPSAQAYLNTGDPGNQVADWPSPAQPGAAGSVNNPYNTCNYATASNGPGANSNACAWAYGYDMVAGIVYSGGKQIVGDLSEFSTATGSQLYAHPVWLDVETANSWESGTSGQQMNTADLQGMVAAIDDAATGAGTTAPLIGIYSTGYQWGQIVGSTTPGSLAGLPEWLPGARSEKGAQSNCSVSSFTGGKVTLTQWTSTYDDDYPCP